MSVLKAVRSWWPVENHEFKKFFPMAFMFCCVLFNYNVLRSIKDALVVANVGAESISFIKVYVTLPMAILFAIIYSKLTSIMGQKNIFYTFCLFFLAFFMIFAFILYPNQDIFHPNQASLDALATQKISVFNVFEIDMSHFKWFLKVFGKWSYALFYVFAELWGSMMLSLLFWQFANSITKTEEAKRFYPMIGFLGNIGLLAGGTMLLMLTGSSSDKVDAATMDEGTLISSVCWAVSFAIIILMSLYAYMSKVVLTDPRFMPAAKAKKKEKLKMSMMDGIKVVFTSKYLGFIALLLICYGFSINLVEGPWKDSVRKVYPTTVKYAGFMSYLQLNTGIFTMIAYFISAQILKRISWFAGAILTPIALGVSGVAFFTFLVLNKSIAGGGLGTFLIAFDPLYLAVIFGLMQNVFSKATKYSFFDPTKEMAYIPADPELQTKGKAAVDVVAARFSKSFGGLFQSTIFILFPAATFSSVSPYFMGVFVAVCILWLFAVKMLYAEYKKLVHTKNP